MTTFYPYQWDLNYANPVVFNDMVENMFYLTNRGIDVIRLDAVPYIWKQALAAAAGGIHPRAVRPHRPHHRLLWAYLRRNHRYEAV